MSNLAATAEWLLGRVPLTVRTALRFAVALSLVLATTGARAAAQDPAFDVWEYQVHGNTRLDVERIERAVYPFLGEGKTIADVEQARAALEKSYRDAGYATALVSIPEQTVASGIVRLDVTEGRIERLRVTGARYYSQGRLLEKVPALVEGEAPNFREVEQQLAAANTADRRVQPLLRPGHQPGTTEVELKVEDRLPLHATFELNNRYSTSRATNPGEYRLSGTVRYDNLWQRDHSIALSYLTSPDNTAEAKVGSIAYTLPLRKPGASLTLYAVRSDSTSDLTTTLAGTSVLGKSRIAGMRLVEPLRSVAGINHNLQFGLDYKDIREDLTQSGAAAFATPLTYWLGSLQYSGVRSTDDSETSFGGTLAFTLRGLRDNETQFFDKRFKGESNLFVLRLNTARTEQLPGKFALVGRVEGQLANVPLPSSEAFAGGGADSVRGYPEGVQIGDQGVRASLEARTPNLWPLLQKDSDVADLRLLAFYDTAYLRVSKPLPAQISRFTLAGTGVGLRLATRHGLGLSLDVAWRLKDGRAVDTHGSTDQGGTRIHFSINYLL